MKARVPEKTCMLLPDEETNGGSKPMTDLKEATRIIVANGKEYVVDI